MVSFILRKEFARERRFIEDFEHDLGTTKGDSLTGEKTTRVSNIDSCALLFHELMKNMTKC